MNQAFVAVVVAAAVSITAVAARADIVLEIDITNPAAVIFRSTGGVSLVTTGEQGRQLSLLGAVAASAPNDQGALLTGNLTAFNGRTYNAVFQSAGTTNLSVTGSNQFQSFTQGQQAFFGSSMANMTFSSFRGFAPVGTVGDVVVRSSVAPVIGQYRIVPAPGAVALLGLAGLATARRRR